MNVYTHVGLNDAADELKRIEECEKGTGKEQGREVYFTKYVPGNLIKKSYLVPCFGGAFVFFVYILKNIVHCN